MTQSNPLTWEAFVFLAGEAGLDPQDPHMEELYPYIQNVPERLDGTPCNRHQRSGARHGFHAVAGGRLRWMGWNFAT